MLFGTPGANANSYFKKGVFAGEELINGNYTKGIFNTGKT